MHPTLNNHEYNMRPACGVHTSWRYFVPEPSTLFSQVSWSVWWLRHQFVTDVTVWLINPNLSCSKNRKMKRKNKIKSTVNDLNNRTTRGLCMFTMRQPQHTPNTRKKLLVSSFLTIHRHQPNQNFGAAPFILFPFTALSNTLCQTSRASK